MTDMKVQMTCMTTKQKFEVEDPTVVVLGNGRYAYKEVCPWEGKNGKVLHSWKFCSKQAYVDYTARTTYREKIEEGLTERPESPA